MNSFKSFIAVHAIRPKWNGLEDLCRWKKFTNRWSRRTGSASLEFIQNVHFARSSTKHASTVKKLVTPKQVAQAINVSESSLKRWCDQGLMTAIRTAGGHRRLALDDVFQFLRQSGQQLVRPELLGLPSNTGRAAVVVARAREPLCEALMAGDEERCRRIVFDLYLAGQSACEICDQVLTKALHDIGDLWECGELSIYRERRALEIGFKMLHELRLAVRAPPIDAAQAVGGTFACDPYLLPTAMIELVLRELGWQATSLGSRLPASTIAEALRESRPRLLWISVSCIESVPTFLEEYAQLQGVATKVGTAVVVGGRALTAEIRAQMSYSAYCDTLRHLATFAASLVSVDESCNAAKKAAAACFPSDSQEAPTFPTADPELR